MAAALLMISCGRKNADKSSPSDEVKVARVFDKYLYLKDIRELVPAGTNKEDSVMLVKNFIDNWLKKNLVLQKADRKSTRLNSSHVSESRMPSSA